MRFKINWPFVSRKSIEGELKDARAAERKVRDEASAKNLAAVKDQLERSHAMEIAKKNALIESLESTNEELRDVAREASELSLRATYYVNSVNQMAIDNSFQSSRMAESVMKCHQTQLHIAENVKRLAHETDEEMEKGRKRLERGL